MATRIDWTAPGYHPEAVGLPWWRRAWMQGLGYYAPSVFFLAIPLFYSYGHVSAWVYAGLVARMLFIAVLYLGTPLACSLNAPARVLWTIALFAGIVTLALPHGYGATLSQAGYYSAMFTCAAAALLPWPVTRVLVAATALATFVVGLVERDYITLVMAVMAGILGWSIASGIQNARNRALLNREQERTAVLAVAAERERIGRDLHDILGHSLTAIAVKTELASRLVERDPAAAKAQIDEVTAVARQALADVRATASGMREVRLANEVAAARSVLAAADIECVTPSSLPAFSDARSELLGYVVREAVTNVVRHSGARRCMIGVDERGVTVSDDGRGFSGSGHGSGLAGLRRRVAGAGGELDVQTSTTGTTIRCVLAKEDR